MIFSLINNFVEEILCLEAATRDIIARIDPDFAKEHVFHVGFEGAFADHYLNPRQLKSDFLGNMVCCEGIVTRCNICIIIKI